MLTVSEEEEEELNVRGEKGKDKSLIVPLYKAIVRLHLEYFIQAWSPYIRKYITMFEKNREHLNSFQDWEILDMKKD